MNSKCYKLSVPYTTAQKLLTEGFAAMTHFQGSCFLLSRILGWPKGRKDAKFIKYKFLSVHPLPAYPEVTHWLETPHWFSAGQKRRGKSIIRFLCSFGATSSPNHPPASMAVPYFLDFPPKTRSPSGNGDRTEQLQEWTGISEPVLQGMLLQSLEWFWRVEGPCGVIWSKQSPRVSGQDCAQMAFGYCQGWRVQNLLGQPMPVLSHPQHRAAHSSGLHQPWKAWDRDKIVREIKFTPSAPPSQAKAGAETAHGLWSIS